MSTKSAANPPREEKIPKYMMMSFRVIRIHDIKNTLSFPSEETSLGRGGFPHISPWEIYHARPALLTVFSITQSDHPIKLMRIQDITEVEISQFPGCGFFYLAWIIHDPTRPTLTPTHPTLTLRSNGP